MSHEKRERRPVLTPKKCTRSSGRSGRRNVARLVERLGADATLTDWRSAIVADCAKRRNLDMSDQCGGCSPDLSPMF
jgi:hypothetical protein